ncbi:MAG TPA: MgtC/SapB family protein [Usitatibacter sp.]|nr:MgtC/SapB family protein [Usitatibacter sp.]
MDVATLLARIGAALAVGAIIGLDRDLRRKPAGVRTHSLVCIGSASVVLATIEAGGNADAVARVIQGLVAGVGFLGAGVIIHHHAHHRVEGLTTAASIWMSAGLGAACGLGRFVLVGVALGAALIVLIAGGPLERAFAKRKNDTGEDKLSGQ